MSNQSPKPQSEHHSSGSDEPERHNKERPHAGGSPAAQTTRDDPTGTDGKAREESDENAREESDGETHELPRDLVFDALKNSRRRHVLRYLKERGGRVSLSDIAEHVAAIENDTTATALTSQQRKRVYVGLYQCHLPKLNDMDVIEFNQSRGHVELGPAAAQLDKHLYIDEEEEEEPPWHHPYVGFVAVSALALTLGAATGLIGMAGAAAMFSGMTLGVVGLAAFFEFERRN